MACYEFNNKKPVVHELSFIHPLAAITGNVIIGKDVYIGPDAAILATGGLNNPQVPYFSPAKWVAKVRENNLGTNPVV